MSEEYASEVKEIVGSLWKVFAGTAVLVGTGYLITTAWDRSVSKVGEHQMEVACEQSFSDSAVAQNCREWSREHYGDCLDNPPEYLINQRSGGQGESSSRSIADICTERQIEHFSRIHGVQVSDDRQPEQQRGPGEIDGPSEPGQDDEATDSENGASDEESGFRPTREYRPTRPVQVE